MSELSPRMRRDEVASFLRCSKGHVYALARGGVLRKYSEGRRFTYWLRQEVEAVAMGRNPYAEDSQNEEARSVAVAPGLNV